MSVNERELQFYHLALNRTDVGSSERQDGQRVQMGAIRGGGEALDLRKGLYGLLQ
jgi:hypothetical protein